MGTTSFNPIYIITDLIKNYPNFYKPIHPRHAHILILLLLILFIIIILNTIRG